VGHAHSEKHIGSFPVLKDDHECIDGQWLFDQAHQILDGRPFLPVGGGIETVQQELR
jgi:hypothetical protein